MAVSTAKIAAKMRDLSLSQPTEGEIAANYIKTTASTNATAVELPQHINDDTGPDAQRKNKGRGAAREPIELDIEDQRAINNHLNRIEGRIYPRYPRRPITLPSGTVDHIAGTRAHAQNTVFRVSKAKDSRTNQQGIRTVGITGKPGYNTWMEIYPETLHGRYITKRNALLRFIVPQHAGFVTYSVPELISADDNSRTLTLSRVTYQKVVDDYELATAVDVATFKNLMEAACTVIACAWQLGVRNFGDKGPFCFGCFIKDGEEMWCPIIKGWSFADVRGPGGGEEHTKNDVEELRRELARVTAALGRYLNKYEEMGEAEGKEDGNEEEDIVMED